MVSIGRHIAVAVCLVFVAFYFLKKKQKVRNNWAIFYSSLYTFVSLAIVNYLCVGLGFWKFTDAPNSIKMPYDIYFVWGVVWGFLPIFFMKKNHYLFLFIGIFWLDFITMPYLMELGVLNLQSNWLIGEVLLLGFVLLPSYLWAYSSYHTINPGLRTFFQVLTMIGVFIFGMPFILSSYGLLDHLDYRWSWIQFQFLLIICFPGIKASYDLVTKGKGTPFPYDPTSQMVDTGVYAYIRNPIQWSFTLMFVPLSIYHNNAYLLLGSLISIAYTIGVSDFQEYPNMENRFGSKWLQYKSNVPKWYFLWKPVDYPLGTIYFDQDCQQCRDIRKWFEGKNLKSLRIKNASTFPGGIIQQVTYIDQNGKDYKSVDAIAEVLERINLGYASLSWFIQIPGIKHLIQIIINSMEFEKNEFCQIK